MELPLVWIILLNYNNFKDSIETLESLEKINYSNFRIVVIDNYSTNDSYEELKEYSKKHKFILLSTDSNLGFAGGNNFGLKYLEDKPGEYILLLNNDTVVSENFLQILVDSLESNKNAALAGGTIFCHHNQKEIWYASGRIINWRGLAVHEFKGEEKNILELGFVRTTDFVTGCMLLIRKDVLKHVGFLDEKYFMYLEDIEFNLRVKRFGYNILYVPQSVIYHKVLGESKSKFKLYYSVRNRLLLINSGFRGIYNKIAKYYFFLIISAKIFYWVISKNEFYKVAITALIDYRDKNFGIGSGRGWLK